MLEFVAKAQFQDGGGVVTDTFLSISGLIP